MWNNQISTEDKVKEQRDRKMYMKMQKIRDCGRQSQNTIKFVIRAIGAEIRDNKKEKNHQGNKRIEKPQR